MRTGRVGRLVPAINVDTLDNRLQSIQIYFLMFCVDDTGIDDVLLKQDREASVVRRTGR